jgi:NAD(P)H-hydrate epimerase
MQKIVTAEEMREIDRQTTEKYGIPSILLMENAAHAVARIITEKLGGSVAGKSFLILCGKGNNGGDGAALARILTLLGAFVQVVLIGKISQTKGDPKINLRILEKFTRHSLFPIDRINLETCEGEDEWKNFLEEIPFIEPTIVIDCLFGTGLDRPLSGIYESLVSYFEIGSFYGNKRIISLDIPSGLTADSAKQIGRNIQADLTVTFTAPKLANVFPPASNFNGELVVANIGSPQELIDNSPSQTYVAEKQDARDWLNKTKVKTDSYKKTRGTALLIAGSKNYTGAATLAANACFAAGAGMVSVGVPNSIREIVTAKVSDEIIIKSFAETKNGAFAKSAAKDVLESSEKMNVVALGCGLTSDEASTKSFVREIVGKRKTPMVIDADGLNALAPFDLQGSSELPIILTPHIGEFERLLGKKDIKDRIAAAREFSQKHNVILLLKGERSLTASPNGEVVINPTGNAGISRAGSGDTLTGIVTAFLAQTYGIEKPTLENTFQAVVAALYIASLAGDIAAQKFGQRLMTATDIRDCLGEAIESITN